MPGEPKPPKQSPMTCPTPTPIELVEYAQDEHTRAMRLWNREGKGGEFCEAMKGLQSTLAALHRTLKRNHDDG